MVFLAICTIISTCTNVNKFVISTSRSFMTNFFLADSFLSFIKSQNDFKEVITHFKNMCTFPDIAGYVRYK